MNDYAVPRWFHVAFFFRIYGNIRSRKRSAWLPTVRRPWRRRRWQSLWIIGKLSTNMDDTSTNERTSLCCSLSTSPKTSPWSSSSSPESPSESRICDDFRKSVTFCGLDGSLSGSSDSSSVTGEPGISVNPSTSPSERKEARRDWCADEDRAEHCSFEKVSNDELRQLSRILGLKNLKCIPNEGGRNVLIGFDWFDPKLWPKIQFFVAVIVTQLRQIWYYSSQSDCLLFDVFIRMPGLVRPLGIWVKNDN